MSLFTPLWPRLRARWPLALLLASIGVTAFAGLDALRVARSNRTVASQAPREYASFAAWSYAQHLEDALSRGLVTACIQ